MNQLELNDSEQRALVALDRAFDMDVDPDATPQRLCDCGWRDFYGVSIGRHEIRFAELVAAEILQARPHEHYEGALVYRLDTVGHKLVKPLREAQDAADYGAFA